MDASLVKLTIKSAEDSLPIIIDKFMSWQTICLEDLSWWWNPNKRWELNKKYAKNVLKILAKEKCLKPLPVEWLYVKTEPFVLLLLELADEEGLLNKCGIETYQEYVTDIVGQRPGINWMWWEKNIIKNTPEIIEYRNANGEIVRSDLTFLR